MDQGYFRCLGLTEPQAKWFPTVGNCCALADGMPTIVEDRADGIYALPYAKAKVLAEACRATDEQIELKTDEDHSDWVKVPEGAIIFKYGNPIGVPVVWWTSGDHTIRCLVNTART